MEEVEFIATIQDGLMWIGLSALATIAAGVVGTWFRPGLVARNATRLPFACGRASAFH